MYVCVSQGPQQGEPEITCQSGGNVLITSGGGFSNVSEYNKIDSYLGMYACE